jgi:hypothetical protein
MLIQRLIEQTDRLGDLRCSGISGMDWGCSRMIGDNEGFSCSGDIGRIRHQKGQMTIVTTSSWGGNATCVREELAL